MKAIIGIDIQNDFVKGGALAYGYPHEDIVPSIAEFLKQRKEAGDLILLTADTHGEDYMQTLEGQKLPVPHCIYGTDGHKYPEAIKPFATAQNTIGKNTFGSFIVKEHIREAMHKGGVDEIILIGGCTSICLLANAVILRASFPNKKISVKESLCFDIDEESHKAAMLVLRNQQIDII